MLPSSRTGAQPASLRARLSTLGTASLLAALIAVGGAVVAPAGVSAATPPWYQVETYYLGLLNCTRTGGWVQRDGTCTAYGSGRYSRYVAPLRRSAGLSSVARAWAKTLAVGNRCAHGDPGARIVRAGFLGHGWGENIGCSAGYASVLKAVLANHRAMQAEQAANGGHWRNMKGAAFRWVGIGVWRSGGRVRLVTDFYAP